MFTKTAGPDLLGHQVGEVVWSLINNKKENSGSFAKFHPAIVIGRPDVMFRVVGLTSSPYMRSTGERRRKIAHPSALGLRGGQSFLWSPKVHPIMPLDFGDHIGFADQATVELLLEYCDLLPEEALALQSLAREVR